MPLPTTVTLPKSQAVTFPDRCVACGRSEPNGTLRIWTFTVGWWRLFPGTVGWLFRVNVPACPGCRSRLRVRIWADHIVMYLMVAVTYVVIVYLLGMQRGWTRRFAAVGLILLAVPLVSVLNFFCRAAIDVTAYADSVIYDFRDRDYAEEFAELNGGEIEVDDD